MATAQVFDTPDEPDYRATDRRFSGRRLSAFFQAEKHWLLVLIPLLLAMIAPLGWLIGTWWERGDTLGFQSLIPIGVAYLIYAERSSLAQTYHGLAEVYPEGHRMRRGTPVVAYLGCAVLFLSYVTTSEIIAVFGFWTVVIGVILYIYGFTILRGLWRPLLFAATMIPVPDRILNLVTVYLERGCAVVAGTILHLVYPQSSSFGNFITIGSYTALVSGPAGGVGILLATLVLTLFLCLLRCIRWTISLILLGSAALIAIITNTVRVVAMGLIGGVNPGLADIVHDAGSIFFIPIAFYLTYLLAERIGPRRSVGYDDYDDEMEDE
ncbi:MAG: exosortase/archaeosortase family protein [Armatimonadetes bacterium]|nr:exosortase/archaeosortase family protein [Armatimonadota bacterium]